MFSFTYVNPHYDIRKVVLIVDSENTAVLIQQSVKLLSGKIKIKKYQLVFYEYVL